MPETSSEGSIVRATLRALVAPWRLAPIVLVSIPLLVAQVRWSLDPRAFWLGLLLCLMCVAVAPVSYRVLFPEGLDLSHGGIRLLLYAAVGSGVVLSVGYALPRVTLMQDTFLSEPYNLAICGGLFLVAGWGLGRDIGFEETLARERARATRFAWEAEQAQLLALRSHLDPHFLFNTLNAIAEWCREDGAVAEAAVLRLSTMLRSVLAGVRSVTWPLSQELELMRTLFDLHLLRDPDLFQLRMDVADGLADVPVPPLLLLPLAENAVKHGPAAGHRGPLSVEVAAREGAVVVTLDNPGASKGPREGSVGLPTVERRLALAYGGHALLSLESADGRTRVTVTLPRQGPQPGVLT
ncbi:histidine kinase family protein [Corallococcus coralloides DSM 2259]|uniref:Histidine kinase family protein n=1 Tax=Corallococcus coralloides (strain ATCC 25202 / DSM 2259 / NBRC 100086 / M2) TaxID=1144275 RepID=H8MQK3_CORCM|nr:histidine kinase [Corallococcus coralloides]AFE09281.1 histidine kinase family protein [Corallococcus coralloides DSM 2259]